VKRLFPALAAVSVLALALPAAAQSWLPINARQALLDARIDQGIRSGSLTLNEAGRLRGQFHDIASLEARYRATGGLQDWERRDLDHRFDMLRNSIRVQTADNQRRDRGPWWRNGQWMNINMRQRQLDARIDQGVRNGTLTRGEAMRLRREYRQIADLEARYRGTGGLQNWERVDLDRRFDSLAAQIRVERADNQTRYNRGRVGYNAGARR
jgi:hypothetical protein